MHNDENNKANEISTEYFNTFQCKKKFAAKSFMNFYEEKFIKNLPKWFIISALKYRLAYS